MALSLRSKNPVHREKVDPRSTWPSWTSSASSRLNSWDKTRGLCKCFSSNFRRCLSTTGVCNNWCSWCFWHTHCWFDARFYPSLRLCSLLCVKFALYMHWSIRFAHLVTVTLHSSPGTCTWSASWRSRWHCSERTAGCPSSPTGTPYRQVAMMTPCLWWAATPAEARLSGPRRPRLPLPQLGPLQPNGKSRKVSHSGCYNIKQTAT